MSLILDALKRAERERHAERSAALEDLPGARAPRRRRWGRWLVLGVLALVAVGAAVGIKRRPEQAATPTVIPAPTAGRPSPAPRPAPAVPVPDPEPASESAPAQPSAPPPIQARPAPPVIPGTEGVASLDDLTPDSDVELVPAPTEPPATAQPPPAAAPPSAQPEPVEAETPAAAAAAPAESPAAEEAPSKVPPALTQRAPMRKLREMPPDYRADFPALTVEVHVFEPGRRFVMINGRRYREGERLAEGPQLVEIVRDGVVLEYRGEKVLYPLGR